MSAAFVAAFLARRRWTPYGGRKVSRRISEERLSSERAALFDRPDLIMRSDFHASFSLFQAQPNRQGEEAGLEDLKICLVEDFTADASDQRLWSTEHLLASSLGAFMSGGGPVLAFTAHFVVGCMGLCLIPSVQKIFIIKSSFASPTKQSSPCDSSVTELSLHVGPSDWSDMQCSI